MSAWIKAQRFKVKLTEVSRFGVCGTIDESGTCRMDVETVGDPVTPAAGTLMYGKNDPTMRFTVDCGILGTYPSCRKKSVKWSPKGARDAGAAAGEGLLADYSITWEIEGTAIS